jgi:signal transduction histidine kinase/ActR/RegA family two-component response regulator
VSAAASGVSEEELLRHAVETMLEVSHADRVGVWVERTGDPDTLRGLVRERTAQAAPREWNRLAMALPFLRPLYVRGETLEQELAGPATETLIGPMLEMRRAVWVPLRQGDRTLGVLFAATRRRGTPLAAAALQSVASELALALGALRERESRLEHQADLAFARETLRRLERGGSPAAVLQDIVDDCVARVGTEFAAIGRAKGQEMEFAWISGTLRWATVLESGPAKDLWRKAMEEGRVVGSEAHGWEFLSSSEGGGFADELEQAGLARIVTLPLEARGTRCGVLVVGLRKTRETLAMLERLELRASLASAALSGELLLADVRDRAARHEQWLEATPQWILDLEDGTILAASRAARESLGLKGRRLGLLRLEELFAAPSAALVSIWRSAAVAGDPEAIRRGVEAVLADGRAVRLHGEPLETGGRWRVRIEPAHAAGASAPDAAASARAEADLLALLEWLEQGVLLFDAQGRVRAMNSRFAQIVGLGPGEAEALESLDALVSRLSEQTADPATFARRWRDEVAHGEAGAREEIQLLRPAPRLLERFGRPVFDKSGQRIGWLELYRDLTPQRLFQSRLLQTEKLASLGQMVTSVAHELSNPLTSIMGYAQRLLSNPPGPAAGEELNRILEEAERASRILRNLLSSAREAKPERRPVNLNEIVERTLELWRYAFATDNITVAAELDPALPLVSGDPDQLQQVVTNLVVNAAQSIQHGRGRGFIRVRTAHGDGHRARLEVSDDGPGIPPAILARIFDPFFTTKPAGVGTGLGLFIVNGIVREHGGSIRVESPPAGGATFLVELPGVAEAVRGPESIARGAELALPSMPERAVGKGASDSVPSKHVLVVEDEPTVARLIADVLGEEGHRVTTLLDSRQAIAQAEQGRYDLVICDLKMPGLDGRHFYQWLARTANPLRDRIIFVTGDTLTARTLEFLERNRLPYLPKPFRIDELKAAVHRLLHEGRARAQAAAKGSPPAGRNEG